MKYTKEQIRELIYDWLVYDFQRGTADPQLLAEGREIAQSCHFAVIENYASGGDTYVGDILAVVWPSSADAFDLFYLEDGLEPILHDCCAPRSLPGSALRPRMNSAPK